MSTTKEPNYFTISIHPERLFSPVIHDEKKYLKLFKNVTDEVAIGEASPLYLIDPETPKLIHKKIPHARIVIMLRDPIERAFSHYLHAIRVGSETKSFGKTIRNTYERKTKKDDLTNIILLEGGFYFEQVKRYIDIFNFHQIKILIFEEFIHEPEKIIKEVLKFLNVNYNQTLQIEKIHNPFGVPRGKLSERILSNITIKKIATKIFPHDVSKEIADRILIKEENKPQMKLEDRLFLQNLYRNDVKNLEALLGRSLPWDFQ